MAPNQQDGLIVELLKTDSDITNKFNPALFWVDVSSHADIVEGWRFDGKNFTAPPAPPPAAAVPTIAELQAQIAVISAQLAALSGQS